MRELRRLANLEGHGDLFERVFWPKFQELVPTVWKMATAKGLVVVRSMDSRSSGGGSSSMKNNDNGRLSLNGREVREWVARGGVEGAMEWLRSMRREKEGDDDDYDDGKGKEENTKKNKMTAITTIRAAVTTESNPPKTTTTTTACGPPSFPLPLPLPPTSAQQTKTKTKTKAMSSGFDYYEQEKKKQAISISCAPPPLPATIIAKLGLLSTPPPRQPSSPSSMSSSSSSSPTSTPKRTIHDGGDIVRSLAKALGASSLSTKERQLSDAADTITSSQLHRQRHQHHPPHHRQTAADNITGPVNNNDEGKGKMSSETRTHIGEQGKNNGRSIGSNGEERGLMQSRWA